MIKVLIADDQAMVRQGFGALLAAQPDLVVVGDAADGAAAVAAGPAAGPGRGADGRPDAGAGRPGGDPAPARRRRSSDGPRVLILTTFDLDDYVYEALRAGASGFLLKDAPAADLVHAVRVVAAGEALLAPTVTRRLIAEFAARPHADRPRPTALNALTPRETEVLRLIARGRSNQEIAADLVVAEQTVKTHIGRILGKLGLRDRAQAVVFAYESGLVAVGE